MMKSWDRGFESEKGQAMRQGPYNISSSEPHCRIQQVLPVILAVPAFN